MSTIAKFIIDRRKTGEELAFEREKLQASGITAVKAHRWFANDALRVLRLGRVGSGMHVQVVQQPIDEKLKKLSA